MSTSTSTASKALISILLIIASLIGLSTFINGNAFAEKTEISYAFIDHNDFSQYWYDGVYRCGTDFEPGDYYIISLFGAGALYDVVDSPDDFSWSYNRVLRKLQVEDGQYVMVDYNSILIPARDINVGDWKKYGVFLVGQDLPSGEYKIETLTNEYKTDLIYIQGIVGAYQICDDNPESDPIDCTPLWNTQAYITLEEGQYIVINDARLSLISQNNSTPVIKNTPIPASTTETIVASIEYADQEAFLADMAIGISNRLSESNKDTSSMTNEERMAFYQQLVTYELDEIQKYSLQVFSDEKFNELAHFYIEACQMQLFAAQNYKNEDLYDGLWNGGSTIRFGIITTLYSRYDLPITAAQASHYRLETIVEITTEVQDTPTIKTAVAAKPTATPTPIPTATPTPKPTATPTIKPTNTPKPTATPKPKTICEVDSCKLDGTRSIKNAFSGITEYYCKKHYEELVGNISKVQNSHACGMTGCSKEGSKSWRNFSGITEYYCPQHYAELMEALEYFSS